MCIVLGVMQGFEWGGPRNLGGGIQKLHAVSIPGFLKRGTLAEGSGAAAHAPGTEEF